MTINAQEITVRASRPSGVLVPVIVNTLLEAEAGGYAYIGANAVTTYTPLANPDYSQYYSRVPFAIQEPTPPTITRDITITSTGTQAARDMEGFLATPGTRVTVPSGRGNISGIRLGGVTDGEIVMATDVIAGQVDLGTNPSFGLEATTRLKWSGGRPGRIRTQNDVNDIIFDGTIFDNDSTQSDDMFFFIGGSNINRFGVFNSMVRLVRPADGDAAAMLGLCDNLMFANSNILTAAPGPSNNSWGFRLAGCTNVAFVDVVPKIAGHKMIRFDSAPVTNVCVDGGIWMRELASNNDGDTFKEIIATGGIDGVTLRNFDCYIEGGSQQIQIGRTFDSGGIGSWSMSNINWFATDSSIVSDSILQTLQDADGGPNFDFGVGTHTYTYNNPNTLPSNPWNDLSAYMPESNPENLV